MHELAIAESIVDVALRHARDRPVARVELKVGHLRQVVPAALTFAFELLAEGTALQGAELTIETVPAAGRCRRCHTETELKDFPLQCESCGGFELDVLRGEELLVDALELEEPLLTKGGSGHGH
jgi:hydrogenase nickel incorporation protein HypA/HybF